MRKPTIVCVDDEKIVLMSLKEQIRKRFGNDFAYEQAENAAEAIELLDEIVKEGKRVVLIVTDWLMPGKKGDELLIEIHQKYPQIKSIMLTGHANNEAIKRAEIQAKLHACVYKPWEEDSLIEKIVEALEAYE